MRELIKKLAPESLKRLYRKIRFAILKDKLFCKQSCSQNGEDRILARIYEYQTNGFYVDVGAHHPFRFSNTYCFYKRGWRGINVDAMPNSMKLFDKYRARDINIESGVGQQRNSESYAKYYIFKEKALNTFDENLAQEYSKTSELAQTIDIKIQTLEAILDKYLPKNQKIDFLSIDCEARDFDVLSSNNFEKFRPKHIVIEITGAHDLNSAKNSNITQFLEKLNYEMCDKCFNSVIFRDIKIKAR